jgi:hypothetical protein
MRRRMECWGSLACGSLLALMATAARPVAERRDTVIAGGQR